MSKRILAGILSLVMIFALLPVSTLAAEGDAEELSIKTGSICITERGYTQDATGGETSYTGSYIVSGEATDTDKTITIESGEINLTISNLNITATDAPAIRVKAGATLNLKVEGTNTLKGGLGYAGISVAAEWDDDGNYDPDASGHLTIDGAGTLNAIGGDADVPKPADTRTGIGGGAGIGGDAFGEGEFHVNGGDFGVIEIKGGTINATGGSTTTSTTIYKYGTGAGIGGGAGLSYPEDSKLWSYNGTINISGGDVTAQGGDGIGSAGIGGAAQGNNNYSDCEYLDISISGGTIKAKGGTAAAGIGGSYAGDHGNIEITGGMIEAIGDAEDSTAAGGGAGIGGGADGGGYTITIGGTAEVTAKGGGAGAGIGGGNGGYSDAIIIKDNANVTAYGGFPPDRTSDKRGGAGIGSGNNVNIVNGTERYETITLNTTGNIVAYGGKGSQAIGLGTCASGGNDNTKNNHLSVAVGEKSGEIWMFNYDNEQSAILGLEGDKVSDTKLKLGDTNALYWNGAEASVWYKLGDDSNNTTYTWSTSGDTLAIQNEDKRITSCTYDGTWHETSDNWAMIKPMSKYTVTFVDGEKTVSTQAVKGGTAEEPNPAPTRDGYVFKGWYTGAAGGDKYDFSQPVTADTTLYAHWAKTYTVSYYLDDGKGAEGADYTEKTEEENTEITLAAAPTKDGYTFTGWSDGTSTYQPGDKLSITQNITLTAQWRKNSSGGTTYYTLHYESNGGTQYKDERHRRNTVVNLDKVPIREGYQFTGWYGDKDLTERVTSVKMTGDKTVYAGWHKSTVPDMLNGEDHFAYVIGYGDGTVHPGANISRAEVATIFFRLLKPEIRDGNLTDASPFADVSQGMWYNKAVATMAKLGIVKGRTAETFDPAAPITRAEFAAICARFDTGMTQGSSNFTDLAGHWAKEEIERAVSLGWIMGYADGTFRPDNPITRAEAMTMINRVLCRIPEDGDDLLPGMKTWPDNQPGDWHYLAVQEATNSHEFQHKGEIHERWTELTADPDWTRYQD